MFFVDLCIDDRASLVIFRSASVRPKHLFDHNLDLGEGKRVLDKGGKLDPLPFSRISLTFREVYLQTGPTANSSRRIHSARSFAGQAFGIKEVHDNIWLVSRLTG